MKSANYFSIDNGHTRGDYDVVHLVHEFEQPHYTQMLLLAMARTQQSGAMNSDPSQPHLVLANYLVEQYGFEIVETPPNNTAELNELKRRYEFVYGVEFDVFETFDGDHSVSTKVLENMINGEPDPVKGIIRKSLF